MLKQKKKYLSGATQLIIRRSTGAYTDKGYTFKTTLHEARKNGDLSTDQGTINVHIELHPNSYKDYAGYEPTIRWPRDKSDKGYLLESDGANGEAFTSEGDHIRYRTDTNEVVAPDVLYKRADHL